MDFPQFFRTAINQATIASSRWRGLALLVKQPDTFRSVRGEMTDLILPATGTTFVDTDCPVHVINKPCLVASAGPTLAGAALLPAKPGVRYLIHTISLSLTMTAIGTTTDIDASATLNGAASTIAVITPVPLTAATYNFAIPSCDILTDVNTAVMANAGTATPATAVILVYYAEVGAS
jgi:hypothetical protein